MVESRAPKDGRSTADGGPPGRERAEDGALDPSLTVAAVARRLGVAPATLRTWDRRYGLGPSQHMAGAHRRYSAADVSRLLTMRRLTLEGVAPSEAARTSLAGEQSGPSAVDVLEAYAEVVPMAADPAALVAAAAHLDNAAVRWMLARTQPRDVLAWWTTLLEPALRTLATRPVLERPGESAVRVLEAAAFAELRSRAAAAAVRRQGREEASPADGGTTVLAVPAGVGPDIVVHVLATALEEHDVATRVLAGARPDAIAGVLAEVAPRVVLVHVGATAEDASHAVELVQVVADVEPGVAVFVHQEGAAALAAPASVPVHRVRTLTGALHEVLAVAG